MKYIYEQQKTYLTDFINSLSLERNLSEKTLYAYKSDLVCLLTWLNENRYDLLNTQSISDYFLYLQKIRNYLHDLFAESMFPSNSFFTT